MAGPLTTGELNSSVSKGRWRYTVATPADDGAIRRLLRESPMPGAISLTFEREPDYFTGSNLAGNEDQTLLAWHGDALVCIGRCSVRARHVRGQISRVAYLAELRLAAEAQGQIEVVRHGYRYLRELHESNPADFYFTSIAADNERARRVLERGLPGMPKYSFLTEYVTRLIPVPKAVRATYHEKIARAKLARAGFNVERGSRARVSALMKFSNQPRVLGELSSVWTEEDLFALADHGLPLERFQLLVKDGKILAMGALWDQRAFRQTVIRGYSLTLSLTKPLMNFCAKVFRWPRLPEAGEVLALAFLSPLAVSEDAYDFFPEFVRTFFSEAAKAGLEYLTLGMAADDPLWPGLRVAFGGREYRSRLYQVGWEESEPSKPGNGLFKPEVALL